MPITDPRVKGAVSVHAESASGTDLRVRDAVCIHFLSNNNNFIRYSETCSCDHLHSVTTSIQGPLGRVPIVALPHIFTSIKRPPQ